VSNANAPSGTAGDNLGLLPGGAATMNVGHNGTTVGTTVVDDGNWHYIVGSDTAPGFVAISVDGGSFSSSGYFGSTVFGPGNMYLGAYFTPAFFFDGEIDEFRVANGYGSSVQVAEYNNQSNPGDIGAPAFLTWSLLGSSAAGSFAILY
jgi:hypothetical protein